MNTHNNFGFEDGQVGSTPSLGRSALALLGMLAGVAVVAFLGSLATIPNTEDGWYATVNKVAWSPPNWLFAPAWTLLYVLMAVAGFLVWRRGFIGGGAANRHAGVLRLYLVQLLLNGLWTPVFFAGFPLVGPVAWWVALADMLVLIGVVLVWIMRSGRVAVWAAWLFVPYVLWLIFAATLNLGVIVLN